MTENKNPDGMIPLDPVCLDLETWEAFESKVLEIRERLGGHTSLPLLYRGQANSGWRLSTTLERINRSDMSFLEYYRVIFTSRPEIESFTGHQWAIPEYPEIEKQAREYDAFSLSLTFGRMPAYDYMIYLRQHGFPSPLLDWTRSPRIAAYFAFRNAVPKGRVSIYMLSEGKVRSGGNLIPAAYRLGQHVKTHRRHFLQQSDYTMCLVFDARNRWTFSPHDDVLTSGTARRSSKRNFGIWKFNIPSTERQKVLRRLDESNLNAFSLFGSEESLMDALALRRFDFN